MVLEYMTGELGLLGLGLAAGLSTSGIVWWARSRRSQREAHLEGFIENINEGYYRSSLDGRQLYANKALVRLNGYERADDMLAAVSDIAREWYVDPNRRKQFSDLLERHGVVENFVSEIYRHKTRERIWITENARIVHDRNGRPLYYEGSVRDFSDTMRRLKLEDLHHKLSMEVPGVLVQARWGADGTFSVPYFSDGFRDLIGDIASDVHHDAKVLFKLLHRDDLGGFIASAEKSAREGTAWNHQFRLLRPDGGNLWVEVNASPQIEADGSCAWHGFLMDVTERKNAQQRIHNLAFYDPLTSLPNRRQILDEVEGALDEWRVGKQCGAMLFIDLDNFKTLNDTRGHSEGDALLVQMSQRLVKCVGKQGRVGRFGGDEFIVLLSGLGEDPEHARKRAEYLANELLAELERPCVLDGGNFHVSCSIGAVLSDSGHMTREELLKSADMAMYEAKRQGKNRVQFFDHAMQRKLDEAVTMMSDLRAAIGTDQLSLHYQMQVDARGKLVGAEGLLRWHHPELGVISPATFIPLTEDSGLILPLTDWLLGEALKTLARWQAIPALADIKLSLNISAQQFHEQAFSDQIRNLVEHHDVRADRLVLEMTEHVLTGDVRLVRRVMEDLKEIGVGFSLDDFGTGYSSLAHLRELPFDEVKIDGSFVKHLESSESDRAIVRSILAMAKALELETVAEWVETPNQREFLLNEGCDRLQGFLYAPALPLKAFEHAAGLPLISTSPVSAAGLEGNRSVSR